MVIFGKDSLKNYLKSNKKVMIGVQLIVEGKDKPYFYIYKDAEITKKELEDIENPKNEPIEDVYYGFIKDNVDFMVKSTVEEINTKKMLLAQNRGISTTKISEVQGYMNLI